MTDPVIQVANEAFGCFAMAVLLWSGFGTVLIGAAIFLQYYWYGGW